jgi:predicted nucleic acid-binding protein
VADYFLDSSVLAKCYHVEVGTNEVNRLLKEPSSRCFISRLTLTEVQSAFAQKVRMGDIGKDEFQLLRRRLLMDVAVRVFLVVRVEDRHYQEAERLIEKHGRSQKLWTLDALQLSVALDLRHRGMLDYDARLFRVCGQRLVRGGKVRRIGGDQSGAPVVGVYR